MPLAGNPPEDYGQTRGGCSFHGDCYRLVLPCHALQHATDGTDKPISHYPSTSSTFYLHSYPILLYLSLKISVKNWSQQNIATEAPVSRIKVTDRSM